MSPGNDSDPGPLDTGLTMEAGAAEQVPAELADAPESVQRYVRELRAQRADLRLQNERLASEHGAVSPQTLYLSLFRPDTVGCLTIGLQSFILNANEDAARLLRVPIRDLKRARLTEFIFPNSHLVYEQRRIAALESGEPQSCEAQLMRRGSLAFWAQLDFVVVRDPASGTRLCNVTVSDVSDLRRSRESMARLASLVESSSDAIISRDMRGQVMSWNRSAQALLGYTAEEIIGQPFNVLVSPDTLQDESMIQNKIRHGETLSGLETMRVRRDGVLLPVSITVSPIYGEDGQIVGVSEIARDLRGDKIIQHHMREQLRQLDLLSTTAQSLNKGDGSVALSWQLLAERLRRGLECSSSCIYVLGEEPETLHASARDPYLPTTVTFKDDLSGRVAVKQEVLTVKNMGAESGAEARALRNLGAACYIGFPLMAHGALLGVAAFTTSRSGFSDREVHVMQTLCDQMSATLERERLIGELRAREIALKEADRRKDDFIATL